MGTSGLTVVAFGEALWDLLPTGPVLGGAVLNFAYRINSLGIESQGIASQGARAILVSSLGRDELGEKARDLLENLGMETEFIQWDDEYPTGTVQVELDSDGKPDFTIIENVAYDYIRPTDRTRELVRTAECLCFGTLAQRTETSRTTLMSLLAEFNGPYVFLDINLRRNCYSEETVLASIARANILKLNEDEAPVVSEMIGLPWKSIPDFAESIIAKTSLLYCVVTLGPLGVFAASSKGKMVYLPTFQVNIEDTVGSGDAFSAGFLRSLLQEQSLPEACMFGNALGALVAGQKGATQKVSVNEIRELMARGKPGRMEPRLENFLYR